MGLVVARALRRPNSDHARHNWLVFRTTMACGHVSHVGSRTPGDLVLPIIWLAATNPRSTSSLTERYYPHRSVQRRRSMPTRPKAFKAMTIIHLPFE
jgi:hypothetical protein